MEGHKIKRIIKLGFTDRKIERNAPFPLVSGDKCSYVLQADTSKYPLAEELYVYGKRADGATVYDSVFVRDGIASIVLKQSFYAVAGELEIRLVLKNYESVLTGAILNFEVLRGNAEETVAEDGITLEESLPKISLLEESLAEKADRQTEGGGFAGGEVGYENWYGVTIGKGAMNVDGGVVIGKDAVSGSALTGSQIAIGDEARAMDANAIQLGKGTNDTADTFQVFAYRLMDREGNVPQERLTKAMEYTDSAIGDVETALDNIIAKYRLGGGSV